MSGGAGAGPSGRFVQARTEDDARLLEQERKLFGKTWPTRAQWKNRAFAAVLVVLLVAAVVGGFLD